jgi:Collagen triple helix repeat (20 copies)
MSTTNCSNSCATFWTPKFHLEWDDKCRHLLFKVVNLPSCMTECHCDDLRITILSKLTIYLYTCNDPCSKAIAVSKDCDWLEYGSTIESGKTYTITGLTITEEMKNAKVVCYCFDYKYKYTKHGTVKSVKIDSLCSPQDYKKIQVMNRCRKYDCVTTDEDYENKHKHCDPCDPCDSDDYNKCNHISRCPKIECEKICYCIKGDKGDRGCRGPTGPSGECGDSSCPTGPQGDQGATGMKGNDGDQGATGMKGDDGDQGATGMKGDDGDQGATGMKGDDGDQGPTGPTGIRGSLWDSNTGAPSATGGNSGDQYLDTETGDVYEWNGTTWIITGNIRGPTGPTGDAGPQGDQGATGDQGAQGETGPSGIRGSLWDSNTGAPSATGGNSGDQYLDTETGDVYEWNGTTWIITGNIRGPTGMKGDDGDQGATGMKGDDGDQGATGMKGDDGDQGATGMKGDDGDQGATGMKGPTGDFGAQGETGPTGIRGSLWDSNTGAPSATGGNSGDQYLDTETGDVYEWNGTTWIITGNIRGPTGPTGMKGDDGDQGPTGTPGMAANTGCTGPTGETGPTGLPGTAANTGCTGPTGAIGDQGETGPTGIPGMAANTGCTGPTGMKGDDGDQGQTGMQGDIGPTGMKGDDGDQGQTGMQGDIGPTGMKGDNGDQGQTGMQGDIGPTGMKGDDGDQGQTGTTGPTGTCSCVCQCRKLWYENTTTENIHTDDCMVILCAGVTGATGMTGDYQLCLPSLNDTDCKLYTIKGDCVSSSIEIPCGTPKKGGSPLNTLTFKLTTDYFLSTLQMIPEKASIDPDPGTGLASGSYYIKIRKEGDDSKINFVGIVSTGDTFTATSPGGATKWDSSTEILIYDNSTDLNLISTSRMHTSCSQPLSTLDQYGSLLLVSAALQNGSEYPAADTPENAPLYYLVKPDGTDKLEGANSSLQIRKETWLLHAFTGDTVAVNDRGWYIVNKW